MSSTPSTSQTEINSALPVVSPDTPVFGYQTFADKLKRNLPTGFEVEIPVPLIEDTNLPLFCISQRPVRYNTFAHDTVSFDQSQTPTGASVGIIPHVMTHPLFHVGPREKISPVKLRDKGYILPNDYALASFTTVTGGVGVTMHLSSNTNISGKLRIAPYSNLTRRLPYYNPNAATEQLLGPYPTASKTKKRDMFRMPYWSFDQPFTKDTLAIDGVHTIDISLNRTSEVKIHVDSPQGPSINTTYADYPFPFNQHLYWRNYSQYATFPEAYDKNKSFSVSQFWAVCQNFYTDSGVAVFLEGDIGATDPGKIDINIDFDYSAVEYGSWFFPMFPCASSTKGDIGINLSDAYSGLEQQTTAETLLYSLSGKKLGLKTPDNKFVLVK